MEPRFTDGFAVGKLAVLLYILDIIKLRSTVSERFAACGGLDLSKTDHRRKLQRQLLA